MVSSPVLCVHFCAPAITHMSPNVPLGHSVAALLLLPRRETIFCFDPLFFLNRPPNATWPVLCADRYALHALLLSFATPCAILWLLALLSHLSNVKKGGEIGREEVSVEYGPRRRRHPSPSFRMDRVKSNPHPSVPSISAQSPPDSSRLQGYSQVNPKIDDVASPAA